MASGSYVWAKAKITQLTGHLCLPRKKDTICEEDDFTMIVDYSNRLNGLEKGRIQFSTYADFATRYFSSTDCHDQIGQMGQMVIDE